MKSTIRQHQPVDRKRFLLTYASVFSLTLLTSSAYAEMDDETAKALLKSNDCTKCHSVSKTKKGPSYKKVAKEYRDKPDAMEKLYEQVTTGREVELEDGTKEDHKIIEAKDRQEIDDLLRWILAR